MVCILATGGAIPTILCFKLVSTNYNSSSPRFDAKSCCSFTDGQTNSKFSLSPVSYPMRIAVSLGNTTRNRYQFRRQDWSESLENMVWSEIGWKIPTKNRRQIPTKNQNKKPTKNRRQKPTKNGGPYKVHQVFINFRGELRLNFVSHLIDAFQRHKIKFFIDQNELRGKDLKHLLFRIEESSIGLAIFSTRYPESSWCMDELVKMKELADQGKLQVIPIFFNVKAEDVRKPRSDSEFGKNFSKLADASSVDHVKNWKEALECISYKMGLSFFGDKGSEADFVKQVVKEVQRVIEEEENHGGDKKRRNVKNCS